MSMNGGIVRTSASEFRIVEDAVNGNREVDEKALSAAAVLEERLEHIRALGGSFARIEISPDMKRLLETKSLAAVN